VARLIITEDLDITEDLVGTIKMDVSLSIPAVNIVANLGSTTDHLSRSSPERSIVVMHAVELTFMVTLQDDTGFQQLVQLRSESPALR